MSARTKVTQRGFYLLYTDRMGAKYPLDWSHNSVISIPKGYVEAALSLHLLAIQTPGSLSVGWQKGRKNKTLTLFLVNTLPPFLRKDS